MDFMDVIERRRTVRDFEAKRVPEAVIRKALAAGLRAPSYNHLKEWDFILVRDQEKRLSLTMTEEMVDSVSDELRASFMDHDQLAREMYLEAIPKQKRMIIESAELLVVVFRPKTQVAESGRICDLNCLASAWCCIENILLSLAEDSVFGVTFVPKNTPQVKAVLSIPQDLEVAAIIPFGYKKPGARTIPQKDARLDDRMHVDRWGNRVV